MDACRTKFVRLFANLLVWDVGRTGRWITAHGWCYIICQIILTRNLIGSCLWSITGQNRGIDDISNDFLYLLYKTSRFHVAVHLSSNRWKRMSKCLRTSVTHSPKGLCATFLSLLHFEKVCDLLLHRCSATWNPFVSLSTEDMLHCPLVSYSFWNWSLQELQVSMHKVRFINVYFY